MSRMFDRILANGVGLYPWLRRAAAVYPDLNVSIGSAYLSMLEQPGVIVVDADNVAEHFYTASNQETVEITDAPNAAPPWDTVFVEFGVPPQLVRSTGSILLDRNLNGSRRAALVQSFPSAALPLGLDDKQPPSDSRWSQTATVFMEFGKGEIALVGTTGWYVREDGTVIDQEGSHRRSAIYGIPILNRLAEDGHMTKTEAEDAVTELNNHILMTSYLALLTYSFINCRNTVIRDVAPPSRLAKASARRGKKLVTYKVLEIEPIKRILAEKGQAEKNGLKLAIHICRGHFKDYRERGLFGKVKGMFWWDHHVRGSASEGVVVKDYVAPAKVDEDVA